MPSVLTKDKHIMMSNDFLQLPVKDQVDLLRIHSAQSGIPIFIVEKDVWICWVLQQLFSMPNRSTMAFKGGTSLSKVFNVIGRFSEDIDITIDYRSFTNEITDQPSRSQLKKLSDELKSFVSNYSKTIIKPYFETMLGDQFGERIFNEQFGGRTTTVEVSDDGEKVRIHYPSVFQEQRKGYFGGQCTRRVWRPQHNRTQ